MSDPDGRDRSFCVIRCEPTVMARARAWLRSHIVDEERLIDAELVATELISNAIDHGQGAVAARITIVDPDRVRIEVDDSNPSVVLTVGHSRLGAPRGNGLAIVDAVASWGAERTGGGKTVWAEL